MPTCAYIDDRRRMHRNKGYTIAQKIGPGLLGAAASDLTSCELFRLDSSPEVSVCETSPIAMSWLARLSSSSFAQSWNRTLTASLAK